MKLLERYATMVGLQIGKQHFEEQFVALPFTRYITLHASSGMAGKNYPLYTEVVNLIKPYLGDTQIVQIGLKDDPPVSGCYHLMGKTTMHQDNYVVTRSLLLLGNDSVWMHRAGHLGIPLVELFSTTRPENHSPYQYDSQKTRFIESHRWGRRPTFAIQESPSTAILIDPYTVARAVLDLLGLPHSITQKTVFVNSTYNATMFDWIPNLPVAPQFNAGLPLNARMDTHHDDQVLLNTLQTGRKVNVVTKAPINLQILSAFRQSILSYNHEIDESTPIEYVRAVRKVLQNVTFFSRTKQQDELTRLRFHFFDICTIQQVTNKTRDDFIKESAEYQNRPADEAKNELDLAIKSGRLKFRTNKFVLSNGKMYLSLAHANLDQPMEGGNRDGIVVDDSELWRDTNHFLFYL